MALLVEGGFHVAHGVGLVGCHAALIPHYLCPVTTSAH